MSKAGKLVKALAGTALKAAAAAATAVVVESVTDAVAERVAEMTKEDTARKKRSVSETALIPSLPARQKRTAVAKAKASKTEVSGKAAPKMKSAAKRKKR